VSEWKEVRLGEVVQINPESLTKDYPFNVIDYIDISSVGTGELRETTQYPISEAPSRAKRLVRTGDTILSTVRPNRRSFLYLKKPKENQVVSTGFAVLRATEKINSRYLYYLISDQKFTDYLVSQEQGAAYPAVSIDSIKNAIVLLPGLETQEKIASILGSIDDKIELNVEMNKTLEEMAMTLYKHWFVENGDIEKVSIEEFGSIIGGGTPKTTVAEYWDGNIPWISVKDLNSAVIIETEKKITEAGLNNSSTKLLPPFSTVLSARGTIGNISIIGKEMTMNQSCYAIKAKDELDCFVFLTLKSSINTLISQSHGSVFNTITKDTLKSLELPFNKDFAIKFEKKVKPMFLQILSNTLENKELQDIRDYLLPRLLSGEIDLSKAEKQVEEVL
jgi:type I restriction enzyme, S subunit